MIFRFIFICLLLCCIVRAEEAEDGARYCDFKDDRKNYDAIDLLQCIDRLAADHVDRGNVGLTNGNSELNGSTARQISFVDIFSSLFNNDPPAPHQGSPFPSYTTSGQHQSNYPVASGGTPGFQLNLFDALSSISRHDDHKCVPRILCEMASGKLPGRSLGKQRSSLVEFVGRSSFTDWLANIDVAGTSPLLNFARAAIVGYSNRGDSGACYEAFPKCPRDANALVYYLNNYKGGFFRLFNRIQNGKYRVNGVQDQQDYSNIMVKERIISGTRDSAEIESVQNTIHFPSVKYYQPYEKKEFPNYHRFRSGNEIIFPDQKKLTSEFVKNSIQDNVAFFPRETTKRKYSRFRFPPDIYQ